jgi:hypothetical protein
LLKITHSKPTKLPACFLSYRDFHLTTFASRTCPRQNRPITLRACQRSRSRYCLLSGNEYRPRSRVASIRGAVALLATRLRLLKPSPDR